MNIVVYLIAQIFCIATIAATNGCVDDTDPCCATADWSTEPEAIVHLTADEAISFTIPRNKAVPVDCQYDLWVTKAGKDTPTNMAARVTLTTVMKFSCVNCLAAGVHSASLWHGKEQSQKTFSIYICKIHTIPKKERNLTVDLIGPTLPVSKELPDW